MRSFRYLLSVNFILLLVMFILPYYSVEAYSIIKNTTSHLGAQNTPNAWIMNTTFCFLGIACILEGWIHLKQYWLHKILLTIFGIGLIFAAVFQHAPIVESIPYNAVEDNLHSLFATIIGFSFTLFAFSAIFIERTTITRWLALLVGLIATALSLLIFSAENYMGLWQRMMFIFSFSWLVFLFEGKRMIEKKGCVH